VAPGLLRRGISGGEQPRQAIFAALALEAISAAEDKEVATNRQDTTSWANLLRDASPREIIKASYGTCPDGFLGALGRIGPKPLRYPRSYADLHRLFSEPVHKHRASALRHVGQITDSTIQIVMALRAPFTTHCIISRLRHIGEAQAFMDAVEIVQSINTQATDEAILDAAKALRPETRLNTLIDRLVKRADILPPCPIPEDDEVRGFKTAAEVIATSRRMQNCLHRKLKGLLEGYSNYCLFRGEVIMEFARLSTGSYLFVGCHARQNGPVADEIEDAAKEKAATHGIPHVVLPSPWQGLGACGSLLPDQNNFVPELAA
jgi:hypothetical protein